MTRRIIVTGCAKSGTLYTSRLLARLGVAAGHERVYNYSMDPNGCDHVAITAAWKGRQVDVNWMAAPFLKHEPKTTIVWHQVRDPLKVVGCFYTHQMLRDERAFAMELVRNVMPECWHGDDLDGGIRYCLGWNDMIERQRGRLPVLFYNVEKLNAETIRYLLDASGIDESLLRGESIEEAFAATPKNVNGCPHHKPLTWDMIKSRPLGEDLAELAERYGYQTC